MNIGESRKPAVAMSSIVVHMDAAPAAKVGRSSHSPSRDQATRIERELDQRVDDVVKAEATLLKYRGREASFIGLALSRGRVRSATLSLGFLSEFG
jgi:hypothetical protein